MFVDNATVSVKAGDGGNGIVSFRRERYIAYGGPDGGDGGDGGDVVFVASNNENTLANFRYQKELKAPDGKNGGKAKMHGRSGDDLIVTVPVGTQLSINDELVADLTEEDQKFIVAKGGKGGFGNAHFTSSTRQAPRVAEKGDPGEEWLVVLELKMIADVGLVGLPNAGKSTLLATLSSAKPKIANYPFTTLNPHLGVVQVDKNKELLLADIPGLIEGASEGRGLGDDFLRHVERTEVLLHMIDAYSDDIVRDYETIQQELKNYRVDLSKKHQIITLTKIEGLDAEIIEDQIKKLKKVVKKTDIFAISALSGQGLKELLYQLYDLVQISRKSHVEDTEKIPVITAKEDESVWQVTKRKKHYIVRGIKIERFARRTDFSSEDGVQRLRDIMYKMGIIKELERKKAEPESRIYFGENREEYLEY